MTLVFCEKGDIQVDVGKNDVNHFLAYVLYAVTQEFCLYLT